MNEFKISFSEDAEKLLKDTPEYEDYTENYVKLSKCSRCSCGKNCKECTKKKNCSS